MFDLLLSDPTDHPLYLQLYRQIRQHIRNGVIAGDTRLPSVRSLQQHLNISKTPIETAYQMLTAEGYVTSKPRSGFFAVNPNVGKLSNRIYHHAGPLDGLQRPSRTHASPKYRFDFQTTAVDKDAFPIRLWKKMINEALDSAQDRMCRYGDPQGEIELRTMLSDYLRNARGVVCSPEQVIIGSGISYSIGLLTKLLAGSGHVAMEEPGFAPVREYFALDGFHVIPIPVRDRGFSLEDLSASEAGVVYVTPSHQFPTGSVMSYAERECLLEWANERRSFIIEDDYDGEFRYFGKPIPSLQSLDEQGRVIYIGTFSKAFTPALRMNYMVLPRELLAKLGTMRHLLLSPSRIEQWAMQAFIGQGHWYRHIRRMRNTYRKKHHRLIELLHVHFQGRIEITGHSAGLHIQVIVKTKMSAEQLLALAEAEGVRVYDLKQMWMSPNDNGDTRIYLGFGGIGEAEMETAVLLLRKAWAGIFAE
ncbi:PLP-dependent aminotransferase family protein [Paenibacillus harenae]|uniref:MocR-like pyridoxine biosynthesis transcription factor PdxR n=1 Tax=Paenibacillus harenae TaxID=306543 RepID=UPI00041AC026|nr:PLP-dependent aminotransferase family protein [Paenibacillus harenae]